jgi:hypothetical protein
MSKDVMWEYESALSAFVIVVAIAVAFVIAETETDGDHVCGVKLETPHFSTTETNPTDVAATKRRG